MLQNSLKLNDCTVSIYAWNSSPKPSLWPPALTFLPSRRADSVSLMPERGKKGGYRLGRTEERKEKKISTIRNVEAHFKNHNRGPAMWPFNPCVSLPPDQQRSGVNLDTVTVLQPIQLHRKQTHLPATVSLCTEAHNKPFQQLPSWNKLQPLIIILRSYTHKCTSFLFFF